jgi:diguanylate cyclase (GGDEF)-like protein
VKRQSCGCLDQNLSETVYDDITDNTSLHSFVLGSFRTIFTAVPRTQVEEWATELVDVLNRKPFYAENFLRKFNEILIKHYHYYKELRSWHKALNILAMGVELHGDDDGSAHSKLSALISATSFVHEIRFKKQTLREIDLNSLRTHIRRLTSALVLTFDLDAMVEKVHAWLPTLMINTALIGVYRTPIKIEDPEADRTIETLVGFDDDKKFNISQNMWNPVTFSRYPTFDGFDMERERRSLFLIPLFFDDFELGAILIPYDVNIPVDAYETLRVSISTAVKGAELISTIRTLSITDELTGLLNRRGFFQFSYSRIYHLSRNSDSVPMVMFMDMDGLKAINDTYGHNEGDVAISAFANILQDVLRKDDIVGRVGGDEFVVFSTVRKAENSEQVVQRIRNKIDEYNAKQLHPFLVSSSIGAVVLSAATKECFEEAMLSADNVLYAEKMEKKKKGLSRK